MKKVLSKDELSEEIAVIVGTRPGIIKMSPIIRALEKTNTDYFIAHTGQHYSYNMDKKFFEDLELPEPQYNNEVVRKATFHGAQTAEMIKELERAFFESKPKIVIVGGDANTNLAGALAARKLGISVAHVEAGLRSNDWRMPEEHNRVMIDHVSEFLFPPTEAAKQNLIKDNVYGKIWIVGNTIVGAINQNLTLAKEKSNILKDLALNSKDYFLATVHREESVDYKRTLYSILSGLDLVSKELDTELIFPIHPRTKQKIAEFNLDNKVKDLDGIKFIEPLGYLDFLLLLSKARMIFTDSGGIQEEACILKIPCVTLRENTERPETVKVGSNMIAGTQPDSIVKCAIHMLSKKNEWENPFGDGHAGKKIVNILACESQLI